MDPIHSLIYGFSIALQPENLLFCFLGTLIGTLVGVLPGIGPVGAISILLPITFKIPSTAAIIMLAGIYYGDLLPLFLSVCLERHLQLLLVLMGTKWH